MVAERRSPIPTLAAVANPYPVTRGWRRENKFYGHHAKPQQKWQPQQHAEKFDISDAGDGELSKTLFIGNVPYDAKADDIWHIFKDVGAIDNVTVPGAMQGKSKGVRSLRALHKWGGRDEGAGA